MLSNNKALQALLKILKLTNENELTKPEIGPILYRSLSILHKNHDLITKDLILTLLPIWPKEVVRWLALHPNKEHIFTDPDIMTWLLTHQEEFNDNNIWYHLDMIYASLPLGKFKLFEGYRDYISKKLGEFYDLLYKEKSDIRNERLAKELEQSKLKTEKAVQQLIDNLKKSFIRPTQEQRDELKEMSEVIRKIDDMILRLDAEVENYENSTKPKEKIKYSEEDKQFLRSLGIKEESREHDANKGSLLVEGFWRDNFLSMDALYYLFNQHKLSDDDIKAEFGLTSYDEVDKLKRNIEHRWTKTKALITAITVALGLGASVYKGVPKACFMSEKEQHALYEILNKPEELRTPEEVFKLKDAALPYGTKSE